MLDMSSNDDRVISYMHGVFLYLRLLEDIMRETPRYVQTERELKQVRSAAYAGSRAR